MRKGITFIVAAVLIVEGTHHGNFILSMLTGAVFLSDGLLQAASALVVCYRRWKFALAFVLFEIALAIFMFQPYPTHYVCTVLYCCVGLMFMFAGWNLILITSRVRKLSSNRAVCGAMPARLNPHQQNQSRRRCPNGTARPPMTNPC